MVRYFKNIFGIFGVRITGQLITNCTRSNILYQSIFNFVSFINISFINLYLINCKYVAELKEFKFEFILCIHTCIWLLDKLVYKEKWSCMLHISNRLNCYLKSILPSTSIFSDRFYQMCFCFDHSSLINSV